MNKTAMKMAAAALMIGAVAGLGLSVFEGRPVQPKRMLFTQEVECNGIWFEAQVEVYYPPEELCQMLIKDASEQEYYYVESN